ncbi:single-stranded DNA-binding protein [Nocardioides terrisoli]|uniref:single-stranded DNA-binding protein n=1 Tax=Nocardioides terrisoli TaxID=3388267 RepID=UPI00287BA267|nr:single-stranded DNA-binding protein [Nocardioides marmorisolisilvae]
MTRQGQQIDEDERAEEPAPNQVVLTGRLTRAPELRELPSGDSLVTFRLSVPRSAPTRTGRRAADWFDCAVWTGRLRTSTSRWLPGDEVTVSGALRRRHFRVAGGVPRTTVEVEVLAARRLTRGRRPDRAQSVRASPQ